VFGHCLKNQPWTLIIPVHIDQPSLPLHAYWTCRYQPVLWTPNNIQPSASSTVNVPVLPFNQSVTTSFVLATVPLSLLVLLDVSTAFDTVDHQILLTILSKRFSMESTTLSWFKSYLADRTQSFTHAGRETCSFLVDCSVCQGSVLAVLRRINQSINQSIKWISIAPSTRLDGGTVWTCQYK